MELLRNFAQHKTARDAGNQRDQHAAQGQGNDAHLAFLANAAPPVPPAVEREGEKEDLKQRVRQQPSPIEDDEIDHVGRQHNRPAEQ